MRTHYIILKRKSYNQNTYSYYVHVIYYLTMFCRKNCMLKKLSHERKGNLLGVSLTSEGINFFYMSSKILTRFESIKRN